MASLDELKAKYQAAADTLRDSNADWLDHLAERLEDPRYRTAAAMLRGSSPGRRPTDDDKALNYAMALLSTGIARSANDAAKRTARLFSEPHYSSAATDRLRKKLRAKLIKSND